MERVDLDVWFPDWEGQDPQDLYEQSIVLGHCGIVLALLWLADAMEDEYRTMRSTWRRKGPYMRVGEQTSPSARTTNDRPNEGFSFLEGCQDIIPSSDPFSGRRRAPDDENLHCGARKRVEVKSELMP
jgi:hypothetical protein